MAAEIRLAVVFHSTKWKTLTAPVPVIPRRPTTPDLPPCCRPTTPDLPVDPALPCAACLHHPTTQSHLLPSFLLLKSEGEIRSSSNLKVFTFNELRSVTRNFRPDSLLGEGGFGSVFKGWIDEHGLGASRPGMGIVIAVKKLNPEGYQGHKEWLAEVNYLGQLHHPNLVRLIVYCAEDDHRLLVYEFMQKGSLENHLFRKGSQPLSWAIRIKVGVGAARGPAFLHNAERQVIYHDFKASNILLDSNFNAKLSDFGLAKDGPTGDNTRLYKGHGYLWLCCSCICSNRLFDVKSDVYSIGVVLLELLSGCRTVRKNKPGIEQNLVEWARAYLSDKHKLYLVMDTRLEGQYSMEGAHKAATLALQRLNSEAKHRPLMTQALETLEQLQNVKEMAKYSQPKRSGQKGKVFSA